MLIQRIALFFAGCLLSVPLAASPRKAYPMDVKARDVQEIIFNVQEGNFVLRGAPDAKEIHMMVSIDRKWIFKLGEQDILKRLIKISGEDSSEVIIRTDIPRGILSFGRAKYPIDFEVVVPDRAKLKVHDTSGKIEITDMKGDVVVQDQSGTVALRNLSGAVTVRKKSGDMKISDISGDIIIESETGQMDIRRTGTLDIRDSKGNIKIAHATSAHVCSRGGNLQISDVKGDLKVDDESGEIVISRVGGNVDIRDTSGQIRTEDTGPLTIRDTSGDITARRAASLEVVAKESGQISAGVIGGEAKASPGFSVKKIQ
jgi:hypothetical protein